MDGSDRSLAVQVGNRIVAECGTATGMVDGIAADVTVDVVEVASAPPGTDEPNSGVSSEGELHSAAAVGDLKEVLIGEVGRCRMGLKEIGSDGRGHGW